MLKYLFLILLSFSTLVHGHAQGKVDSFGIELQRLASKIQSDTTVIGRYEADSIFTKSLVQHLKIPFSFNLSFDSLVAVRQIIAPDSSFKFFSWQLDLGDGNYKQRAALQVKTEDGNLKLLPFFDKSDDLEAPEKAITSRKKWFGAIYYDIILTNYNGIRYYTLLGFDEYNKRMSRKVIEVIHFEQNEPIIGGNYFIYPPDETYPIAPIQRFIYTYKKGSNGYIRYDKELNSIVLSELTSIGNNLKDKSTLVPSGNEVYFLWNNGKWVMPKGY